VAAAAEAEGLSAGVEALLALVGGDRVLVSELFALFAADAPARLRELRDALTRGDAASAALTAHTLKGSAGNLYITAVEQAAAEVERLAHRGDLAAATRAAGHLDGALAEALARMARWPEAEPARP
jgi:HPt (histidine-containing phosphotransfer) domain-containing protein